MTKRIKVRYNKTKQLESVRAITLGQEERREANDLLSTKMAKKLGGGAIIFYQLCISPLLPSSCRFYPTCSDYCRKAIEKYGLLKGSWLGIKRLIRCHPLNPGGYDPVK